jgi:hypothetical protein
VVNTVARVHRHRHLNGWPDSQAVDEIVDGQNHQARMAAVRVLNLMAVVPERWMFLMAQ